MRKLLTVIASGAITIASGQQTAKEVDFRTCPEYTGTYQIQVIGSRMQPEIPANICDVVEENRKYDEVAYYKITEYVRIMVLPLNVITRRDFEKVQYIKQVSL